MDVTTQPEATIPKSVTASAGRIGTAMLERLAELDPSSFSLDSSRVFLQLAFTRAEQRRVDELSEKARQGSLTPVEEEELDEFIHVANLLAIVQSKARQALKLAPGCRRDMAMAISADLDRRVRERAKHRCEYCRLPQSVYPLAFQIDHIIAEQHHGRTQLNNLSLACPRCNRRKGPNLSGIDIRTRQLTPLYHPRRDRWHEHFRWRGPRLVGLTPVGRVTIQVLNMNHPEDIKIRRILMAEGAFPPNP